MEREAVVGAAEAILFASPSAAEAFMKGIESVEGASALTKRLPAFCIGPVTAAAARKHGFETILTPKTNTIDGLLQLLVTEASSGEGS